MLNLITQEIVTIRILYQVAWAYKRQRETETKCNKIKISLKFPTWCGVAEVGHGSISNDELIATNLPSNLALSMISSSEMMCRSRDLSDQMVLTTWCRYSR